MTSSRINLGAKMDAARMEQLVQRQADEYNKRNLEAFCACYHPEIEVSRNMGEPPSIKGIEQFRESYRDRFEKSPTLHCEIRKRIVLEKTVADEEYVTGLVGNPNGLHVVAIYGFREGLISHVWFAR